MTKPSAPKIFLLLALSVAPRPGFSAPTPQAAIQAEYDKSCEAAGLKFIDGMGLCRAPQFVETSPVGQKVEPLHEHQRLQDLFATALTVKETVHIVSFHQTDAHHAVCRVTDLLDVLALDSATREPVRLLLEAHCEDRWAEGNDGWQETARHVLDQSGKQETPARTPRQQEVSPSSSNSPASSPGH